MNQTEATCYYTFADGGYYYLFNTARVSVFQVPEPVFRLAGLWESRPPREIYDDMCRHYPSVQVQKYLNDAVKLNLFSKSADQPRPRPSRGFNELYLQVCHDCNLKCRYCYADGGHFGGDALKMEESVAVKAVDMFIHQLPADMTGFINFDGGEPLLNWPVIEQTSRYAVDKARQCGKTIAFKLGTNGTLLNRKNTEFMNRYGFSVGISMDGDPVTHNANRRFNENTGSYESIKDNITAFKKSLTRCTIQARATITPANLDVSAIVHHLFKLGFNTVYFEPVSGVDGALALTETDYDSIDEHCTTLAETYAKALLDREKNSITNFDMFLKRLHLKQKFHYKCEVGRTGIAVTPGGGIYPCYKFANTEGFEMADIENGGMNLERQNRFTANHVDGRSDCKNCWARYLCGGGCAYLGHLEHQDISRKTHWECRFTRSMIKLAMTIYVKLNRLEPGFWNRYFDLERTGNRQEDINNNKKSSGYIRE